MASYQRRRSPAVLPLVAAIAAASVLLGILGWYLYDSNVDRSGWTDKLGVHSYLDFHGKPVTGWQDIDGQRYYFDENYAMLTGWRTVDNKRRYFTDSGALASGWMELEGERYYFLDTGNTLSGWQTMEGGTYYFADQGYALTGWQEMDGARYRFDDLGAMVTGWMETAEGKFYFAENGILTTGQAFLDGENYLFDDSGVMQTGWVEFNDGRRYYAPDGHQCFGWQTIDDKRYYFDDSGIMATGWIQDGEYRYYLLTDGSAATGPQNIDGRTYYFTPDGIEVLLVNYRNPLPSDYNYDLVTYSGWTRVSAIALQPLRDMIADCKAAGDKVYVNCAYRSRDEQTEILETRTQEYMDKGMGYGEAYAKTLETVSIPGYSEHHTGLAMDIVCEGDWLLEHCWEYGFILRYPEDKKNITNIVYERWHFRYVGTAVSMAMKDTGLCLEEYLGAA